MLPHHVCLTSRGTIKENHPGRHGRGGSLSFALSIEPLSSPDPANQHDPITKTAQSGKHKPPHAIAQKSSKITSTKSETFVRQVETRITTQGNTAQTNVDLTRALAARLL